MKVSGTNFFQFVFTLPRQNPLKISKNFLVNTYLFDFWPFSVPIFKVTNITTSTNYISTCMVFKLTHKYFRINIFGFKIYSYWCTHDPYNSNFKKDGKSREQNTAGFLMNKNKIVEIRAVKFN